MKKDVAVWEPENGDMGSGNIADQTRWAGGRFPGEPCERQKSRYLRNAGLKGARSRMRCMRLWDDGELEPGVERGGRRLVAAPGMLRTLVETRGNMHLWRPPASERRRVLNVRTIKSPTFMAGP